MKFKKILILIPILLICGVMYMSIFRADNKEPIGKFSLNEYQYFIENFPSDKVLGNISNASKAKEEAEKVWIEIYGEDVKKDIKPYVVMYDETSKTWLVTGTLPKNMLGGVPNIIIQGNNGKVLAVWHDK